MQLREATLDDLDVIAALEQAFFAGDAWSRELVAAELDAPWTTYLVVEDDARILGYAGVSVPADGAPADIQTIAVHPDARRQGLGRVLLLAATAAGEARGATESLLEVRADNLGAQELYRSLGYEQIAVRPRYYQPDDVDAIVMRAVLPLEMAAVSTSLNERQGGSDD